MNDTRRVIRPGSRLSVTTKETVLVFLVGFLLTVLYVISVLVAYKEGYGAGYKTGLKEESEEFARWYDCRQKIK